MPKRYLRPKKCPMCGKPMTRAEIIALDYCDDCETLIRECGKEEAKLKVETQRAYDQQRQSENFDYE